MNRRSRRGLRVVRLAVLGTLVLPATGVAQRALTVMGGAAAYDLSGTGWSGIAEARVELAVRSWLRGEIGSGVFGYDPGPGLDHVMMLLPEAGVAFQGPGVLPLYLGLGVGRSLTARGPASDDFVLYGSLGLALPVAEAWQIRTEGRLRAVGVRAEDFFVGSIADLTVGVSRRF